MSMMKTLAKVAIGVAVAKGISSMMNKSGGKQPGANQTASRRPKPAKKSGTGGLFGGQYSPGSQTGARQTPQRGSLEEELGNLLGNDGKSGGGLGGLLDQLGGTPAQPRAKDRGGFEDVWGGDDETAPSRGGQTPDLGGLLGGLIQAATGNAGGAAKPKGGFGDLLNQAIARQGEPEHAPTPRQEATAALMLRAMIQAAKSDGRVDRDEEQKLLGRLGDVSPQERAFVQEELSRPVDVHGLANAVPRGMEQQLYSMSVMGIDLDSRAEANYLHELAQALRLEPQQVNNIHDQLGVQPLYS